MRREQATVNLSRPEYGSGGADVTGVHSASPASDAAGLGRGRLVRPPWVAGQTARRRHGYGASGLLAGRTVCDSAGMSIFEDLAAEEERLEKILSGLDEAQWASASAAAGWTI